MGRKLTDAMKNLNNRFGDNSIATRSNYKKNKSIKTISSGSIAFDKALGGGWAVGRVHEIFGGEGSAKSTMALNLVRETQKQKGTACYIDLEHALNIEYAEKLGVNVDNMLLSQPSTGEDAFEMSKELIKTGEVDLIVIDSVDAMISRAEFDAESGDRKISEKARLMNQGLRQIIGLCDKYKCTFFCINQTREKVGVIYGSNVTTPGGNALKFYSFQRVEIKRRSFLKDGDDIYGGLISAKVIKNKLSPPFKVAEFELIFGEGINTLSEIIDFGVHYEILQKKGAWYNYSEVKLGQGKKAVVELLKDNVEMCEEIEKKVYKAMNQAK